MGTENSFSNGDSLFPLNLSNNGWKMGIKASPFSTIVIPNQNALYCEISSFFFVKHKFNKRILK